MVCLGCVKGKMEERDYKVLNSGDLGVDLTRLINGELHLLSELEVEGSGMIECGGARATFEP